jgi:hypothetical protein
MILTKDSVRFRLIRSETLRLMQIADEAYKKHGFQLTITCGTDGHPPDDPHFNGYAIDMRTHGIPEASKAAILQYMVEEAGPDYYIFLESPGTDNEHFHGQLRKGLWQERMQQEGRI